MAGKISLTARHQDDDVVVSVKDNGVGIPPDRIGGVFDMFSQVGTSLEHAQGGLGIGLTLVKQLVTMHGGTVEARAPVSVKVASSPCACRSIVA